MGKEKRRENLQREEYDRNVEKKDKLGEQLSSLPTRFLFRVSGVTFSTFCGRNSFLKFFGE